MVLLGRARFVRIRVRLRLRRLLRLRLRRQAGETNYVGCRKRRATLLRRGRHVCEMRRLIGVGEGREGVRVDSGRRRRFACGCGRGRGRGRVCETRLRGRRDVRHRRSVGRRGEWRTICVRRDGRFDVIAVVRADVRGRADIGVRIFRR